jgi:hypothetical protein
MSKKIFLIAFLIITFSFFLGFIAGLLDIELRLTVFIDIFIIVMVIYYSYYLYIMFFTKNVNLVEKFINIRKKHPYYSLLIAIANKKYDQAEQYVKRLGLIYNQIKVSIKAGIQIENKQLDEAEETIQKIKNHNIRNYNLALLALSKRELGLFETFKSQVKHKGLQYALDAELAYIRGKMEEAEKFGELAISSSRGLQKWLLVKSLEHQRNNEDRQSFF